MTRIYVFPGQGSQSVGMGKDLFDRFPDIEKQADQVLGYSIRKLCLEDPDKKLNNTDYTQPALFVVNALTYLSRIEDGGGAPDYTAGHSLGEYNALFAAGVFDFTAGVRMVQRRGAIMAKAAGGGMAAIIGMEPDRIKEVLSGSGFDFIDVANYNSPSQTVISGLKEEIGKVKEIFEKAGARLFMPLNVSGAFHSRYMKPAGDEFAGFLDQFTFNAPKIPVVANFTGCVYDPAKIKETLASQITNPVRWVESIRFLKQQADPVFEEIGPGKVLTRLIAQI